MSKKIIVGLHKDENNRFDPYLQIYENILAHNNIPHVRVEASQPDFWEVVANLDLLIFHWVYIDRDQQLAEAIMPIIEKEMGVQCFPDWSTFWHYNNKIKQYYLLRYHNFPTIESYPLWDRGMAQEWIALATYPVVFKLNRGALSEDVMLVKSRHQAEQLTTMMFNHGVMPGSLPDFNKNLAAIYIGKARKWTSKYKRKLCRQYAEIRWQKEKNYVFYQKFLPANPYTTRITVIGNRAFCFNIKTVKGDFRACDMQNIDYDQELINKESIKIAFEVSKTLCLQCMSYDFLFDQDGTPQICEMGYTAKAHDIYQCDGYWDAELSWHEGHYWPQYCQLIDLLKCPDLRQPEIDFRSLN